MDDLNRFPKKLLLVSIILVLVFLGVLSVTFFYYPVVPVPYKISMTIGEKLPGAADRYKVNVSGAPLLSEGIVYKVKIFVKGESYFCTLTPDRVMENNSGDVYGTISGIPGVSRNDLLNGVAYKDSLSPLPLIRLMFK